MKGQSVARCRRRRLARRTKALRPLLERHRSRRSANAACALFARPTDERGWPRREAGAVRAATVPPRCGRGRRSPRPTGPTASCGRPAANRTSASRASAETACCTSGTAASASRPRVNSSSPRRSPQLSHRPTCDHVESSSRSAHVGFGAASLDQPQRRRRVVVDDGMPRREHSANSRPPRSTDPRPSGTASSRAAAGTGVTSESQRKRPQRQDQRSDIGSELSNQLLRLASADEFGGLAEEGDGGRDPAAVQLDETEETAGVAHRGDVVGRLADRLDLLGRPTSPDPNPRAAPTAPRVSFRIAGRSACPRRGRAAAGRGREARSPRQARNCGSRAAGGASRAVATRSRRSRSSPGARPLTISNARRR